MPFAMVGFVLGMLFTAQSFDVVLLFLVVACMVFARSAAMAFNRWQDRDIDAINPRTTVREIPSGIIHADYALIFVVVNVCLFILTTWFINPLCFYLSPIAILVILGYSYTKRFTALCHLVLGLGLSLAPVGAYIAVTGSFDTIPILLGFCVLFWVSGFDIIYALQDKQFDEAHKLHSIPVSLGVPRALLFSRFLHILSSLCMLAAIYSIHNIFPIGALGFIGVITFLGMLVYQHVIIGAGNLSRVNMAFFTTNGIASVVFGTLLILDLLWK